MKERPMLFSALMVRALLSGAKTQTRREFKAKNGGVWPRKNDLPGMSQILRNCPYGQPGDRIWVRETWAIDDEDGQRVYRADLGQGGDADDWERNRLEGVAKYRWQPSIYMPRRLSRITLEITGVRVERLQDISEADAKAEGAIPNDGYAGPERDRRKGWVDAYKLIWKQINGPKTWDANPYVWVVEFRRVEGGTE